MGNALRQGGIMNKPKTMLHYLFFVHYEEDVVYVAIDRCDFEKARQAADEENVQGIPKNIAYLGEIQVEIQSHITNY